MVPTTQCESDKGGSVLLSPKALRLLHTSGGDANSWRRKRVRVSSKIRVPSARGQLTRLPRTHPSFFHRCNEAQRLSIQKAASPCPTSDCNPPCISVCRKISSSICACATEAAEPRGCLEQNFTMDPFPSSQASQASQASHEILESSTDLLENLMFQRTILASIDDTVADRAAAENEVKEDIRRLERQYRDAKRREKQAQQARSSSHAGPSSHQHTNNQRPSFTAMSDEPFAHGSTSRLALPLPLPSLPLLSAPALPLPLPISFPRSDHQISRPSCLSIVNPRDGQLCGLDRLAQWFPSRSAQSKARTQ